MSGQKITDFLEEFTEALEQQLIVDEARWGDTWLRRTREGQEERIENDFNDYFDQFKHGNKPVPWLKVVGNAMIAWVREQHPELFPK